ncbi:MAG: PSD1 domain-containing protein [Planctomycetales bacterium]|nr:PSD1 domain-containing protein [Planctomycetales bacterium]
MRPRASYDNDETTNRSAAIACRIFFACCVAVLLVTGCASESVAADDVDFFERHIRPLFVEHCYECHSEKSVEGGLRLDSRQHAFGGGDRGPSIVAGRPDASLLMRAVSYDDEDLAMPPDGKLSQVEVAQLSKWISDGAAWPDDEADPVGTTDSVIALHDHWAFQPLRKGVVPKVDNEQWARNPIDAFVYRRLKQQGLTPSSPSSRYSLIRRAYLDLLGLPPTFEDVRRFEESPDAEWFSTLVTELLSQPEYGERWARHWLDVARYADTKGYVDGGQVRFAFAYTYRDYVIRAMNEDLPYDKFVIDQIAADAVDYKPDQQWRLAGMGFLTVGRRFNHNLHDIIDDQIDVVSRGLLGLSVTCARCHDHKYDPVPTADYYSLYGIFASSFEPQHSDLPFSDKPSDLATHSEYLNELKKRADQYDTEYTKLCQKIQHELRAFAKDYLVYVIQQSPKHRSSSQNDLNTGRTFLRGPTAYGYGAIARWQRFVDSRTAEDPVFGLWKRMDAVDPAQFMDRLQGELASSVNDSLRTAVAAANPQSMVDLVRVYGDELERVYVAWTDQKEKNPEAESLPNESDEQLRQVLYGPDSPASMSRFESIDSYHLDEHTNMRNLAGKVEELSIQTKDAPSRAMILRSRAQPIEPVIFRRGQPNRPGELVPRQIPTVYAAAGATTRPSGNDRLALAHAVVSKRNPLAARVIVNRIWHWHFGQPLVETVSDFGTRGSAPTHPDLLDYLATWLIEHDWSLKQLHLLIMESNTYRQESGLREECAKADPENEFYWRYGPRRVEWEVIRDSLLAVSNQLEKGNSGRPVELKPDDPNSKCRTIYLHLDRQEIPKSARYFDFPSPDFTSPQRPITTVPQQQLFFLNSPFVHEQSSKLAKLVTQIEGTDVEKFVLLHRKVFARDPASSHDETDAFLSRFSTAIGQASDTEAFWQTVAHALLQSNEFIFVE